MSSRLRDINWWLEHTEGHREISDGYLVLCPAHDDRNPSLHLTRNGGKLFVHCLAGCSYHAVLQAVTRTSGGSSNGREIEDQPVTTLEVNDKKCRAWWTEYTGISDLIWESWGVSFTPVSIDFIWETTPVKKKRRMESKQFEWFPPKSASPPFWPSIGDKLPERIFLIGGETDCGVLRICGYEAYALMKGEGFRGSPALWAALHSRGVREIIFGLDADEAGIRGVETLTLEVQTALMSVGFIRTVSFVDPLRGEKDFRDVWKRVGLNISTMRSLVETSIEMAVVKGSKRMNIIEFLEQSIPHQQWLVNRILLRNTIHLIIGPPKMMKTWLALDLGISIATNSPFLGHFEVDTPGRVVYISKEDPDYLLHDRLGKILVGKGLGGRIEEYRISLPARRSIPFEVDLNRDFYFTLVHAEELIRWIESIGGADVVIFDPVLRMIPEGIDEFKATEVEHSIFQTSEKIRSETGASVVLVHHKSKNSGEKSSYGSIGFRAFGEGFCYLLGDGPDTDGYIQVQNEYKSAPDLSWEYNFEDLEFRYAVTAQERNIGRGDRPDVIRDLIFHRLESKSPDGLTVNDLLRVLNGPTDFQVREALIRLETEGEVYREKESDTGGRAGKKRDVWFVKKTA